MMSAESFGRRSILTAGAMLVASRALPAGMSSLTVPVHIDTREVTGPLQHIWGQCIGSDRAAMTLRDNWRQDLDRWRDEVGIRQVRFHGIFNDELGVDTPSILSGGKASPNFRLVDQVYDGLIARGVGPLIELGFMPKALASGTRQTPFTYGGNVTPPSSLDTWTAFLTTFVRHLVDRYGIATVRRWPFEVWNEPNLPAFWAGTQQQYFDLYKASAIAIKSIDSQLQVGGPATASIGWLPDFASYCAAYNAPVDFFSTHIYAGDDQRELFGSTAKMSQNDVIPSAIAKARMQIEATRFAGHPLWITEWSSDSPAMIAHVIARSLPYCQLMSQWALSAEFEELGIPNYVLKEGDTGWGMLTAGIAKPSFNTYKLLRRLGMERLHVSGPALATRRGSHSVAAMVWNLAEATQPSGIPGLAPRRTVLGEKRSYQVEFSGARPGQAAVVRYVDQERGSPMPAWRAMGSPQYPTPLQIAGLRRNADIGPPEHRRLDANRKLTISLPPEGVALIELAL